MKPRICVLRTDGTNCHEETAEAFTLAGGEPTLVHVNSLRAGTDRLANHQALVLPGGFSYGDDIASGKVLAIELLSFLGDQLQEFVAAGKPVVGICNGFQVLVRTGLLPYPKTGRMHATLAHNTSGHFQCGWVELTVPDTTQGFTQGLPDSIELQMAHGEGRFLTDEATLSRLQKDNLIVLRYASNPNGSQDAVAGICDPTRRIFGLMPHPERFVRWDQHPNWRRRSTHEPPHGLRIFQNVVRCAASL